VIIVITTFGFLETIGSIPRQFLLKRLRKLKIFERVDINELNNAIEALDKTTHMFYEIYVTKHTVYIK